MGLHKLSAGDGCTYLTRQVAAHDATEIGSTSLGDYYAERGESPGVWLGAGLAGLGMVVGGQVSGEQMAALFGQGRHPNAAAITEAVLAAGGSVTQAEREALLGKAFAVFDGANEFRTEVAQWFTTFNRSRGQPWNAPIPTDDRARIRSEVAREMFAAEFGRPPAGARELSGFIARASRPATKAVAGYDLTFSPVKSVSALWAIAPPAIAEQVAAAHQAAVADTIGWLEHAAVFTRTGRAGVRQVDTRGVIAAAFTHRDSRAGDPDLHTHVAVSNKVQAHDGRWLAIDGRVLFRAKVAASERYNTRLEAELTARLGVRFTDRPDPDRGGKRPVREIVGIDPRLLRLWSSRRAAITVRQSELARKFQADHGRPPTSVEAIDLAQQATLETREAKHEPRSLAEQRATWRAQARRELGGDAAVERMVAAATGHHANPTAQVGTEFVAFTAESVIEVVQADRASWRVWHVRAEAERQVRAAGIQLGQLDRIVDQVVEQALSPACSIRLSMDDPISDPPALRRRDGHSVYQVAGSAQYSSPAILRAERLLLAHARRMDGPTVSDEVVQSALVGSATAGLPLNPGQAQMVTDLGTSGACLQVAIAPAGSGKTTAMATLAAAWNNSGGQVVGLAPSARAAAELRQALDPSGQRIYCDTLTKLTHSLTTGQLPPAIRAIGSRALVVIDEAAMAGTLELAQAVEYMVGHGASVRLIGDDQQLASVAAGGIMRDLADQAGAATLSQLQRFTDPAEAAATLAVRDGDHTAIGFYLDQHRIHVGDATTAADQAYAAWAADHATGRNSVLLAPTRDLVTQLNQRARTDRLAHQPHAAPAVEVALADGNHASAGDVILTRRNERRLPISATDWVKNGDRWRVTTVHPDGYLTATHVQHGLPVRLPAAYVHDNVELGYASTVHAAQGITADTCHTVASGEETRQLTYVALSRGRHANHLYLTTVGDGDPHSITEPDTLTPPTAGDLLARILSRDGAQHSAMSTRTEITDPSVLLHEAASRYHDSLIFAAEQHVGVNTLTALDAAAEQLLPGLTEDPAYPTLRAHLTLHALDGTDPIQLLTVAASSRELESAVDPAAVLHARLPQSDSPSTAGPLRWLPPIPRRLLANPDWATYLDARASRVTHLARDVGKQAEAWPTSTAPPWAQRLPALLQAEHADLRAELAVWRAVVGVPGSHLSPTGAPQRDPDSFRYQQQLARRIDQALGRADVSAAWASVVGRIDSRLTADPFWPGLAQRLAALQRAGIKTVPLVQNAAAERVLPDEHPAAALWWRLARHLTPAVAVSASSHALRPDWTPILTDTLGQARTQRILTDPAWPALVAAIDTVTGRPDDLWTPAQLIPAGVGLIPVQAVDDSELATALIWHIATLTSPEPNYRDTVPPDPADDDLVPPEDLHLLPVDQPELEPTEPPARTSITEDGFTTRGLLLREMTRAEILRGPLPPTDAELWAPLDEEYKWATAAVSKDRLIELNQHAQDYFTSHYPGSWAHTYLQQRLHTTLADDPHYAPGYAPTGWTNLTDHLRQLGATEEEILAAGLSRRASTGRIIDAFRDRLTLPIYGTDGEIHSFITRRNPDHDSTNPNGAGRAGPKYLNTRQTDLHSKGAQLYGHHEGRHLLATGAVPILVEGPLDAIAITHATAGSHVGLATLGTAFTDQQANQLLAHLGDNRSRIIVATDPDAAGWKAAQRAYWQLTARGFDPQCIDIPDDSDPASTLERHGPDAIRALLAHPSPLAGKLIDSELMLRESLNNGGSIDLSTVAAIIAARPSAEWRRQIDDLVHRTGLPIDDLEAQVARAANTWTANPREHGSAELATTRPTRPTTRGNARQQVGGRVPNSPPRKHHAAPPPHR